jgi:hypothetical protein
MDYSNLSLRNTHRKKLGGVRSGDQGAQGPHPPKDSCIQRLCSQCGKSSNHPERSHSLFSFFQQRNGLGQKILITFRITCLHSLHSQLFGCLFNQSGGKSLHGGDDRNCPIHEVLHTHKLTRRMAILNPCSCCWNWCPDGNQYSRNFSSWAVFD